MTGWDEMILVGRVARPHGLRGQVIVNVESDFPDERFRSSRAVYLRRGGTVERRAIEAVRFHRGRPILTLEGVTGVEEAQALAAAELRVPPGDLTPLEGHRFYRHDLVGCRVALREGREVGVVVDVVGPVEGSRLVVQDGGREMLVPLAAEICVEIDPAARRIVLDPPEGLLELND